MDFVLMQIARRQEDPADYVPAYLPATCYMPRTAWPATRAAGLHDPRLVCLHVLCSIWQHLTGEQIKNLRGGPEIAMLDLSIDLPGVEPIRAAQRLTLGWRLTAPDDGMRLGADA